MMPPAAATPVITLTGVSDEELVLIAGNPI